MPRKRKRAKTRNRRRLYGENPFCHYCGLFFPSIDDERMTVDHFIPIVRGGSNGPENKVLACRDCNAKKDDQFAYRLPDGKWMFLREPRNP